MIKHLIIGTVISLVTIFLYLLNQSYIDRVTLAKIHGWDVHIARLFTTNVALVKLLVPILIIGTHISIEKYKKITKYYEFQQAKKTFLLKIKRDPLKALQQDKKLSLYLNVKSDVALSLKGLSTGFLVAKKEIYRLSMMNKKNFIYKCWLALSNLTLLTIFIFIWMKK